MQEALHHRKLLLPVRLSGAVVVGSAGPAEQWICFGVNALGLVVGLGARKKVNAHVKHLASLFAIYWLEGAYLKPGAKG